MGVDYAAMGKQIAKHRKQNGLTQEALAEAAEMSLGMIGTMEAGKTKASLETLVKIANVLHTTVDTLLYDNVEDKRNASIRRIAALTERCSEEELKRLAESLEGQYRIVQSLL